MLNKKLTLTLLLTLTFNSGCVDEQTQTHSAKATFNPTWTLTEGLAQPESVLYDPKNQRLYVSNVEGSPVNKDGKGYISIVSLDGQLLEQQWIKNLNAPKGMAMVGNTLYVSDIDALVMIDIKTAKIVERFEVTDAQFLNDVTADKKGNVYVSDMMTDTIHCLCNGQFETWLHDAHLMSPNGLLAEENRLVVGSWGKTSGGFETTIAGHLKTVNYVDKQIISLGNGQPVGHLDGVESDGANGYYVTDWMAGQLFYFDAHGKVKILMQLKQGSADHTYIAKQNLLLIPMMNDNQLKAFIKK